MTIPVDPRLESVAPQPSQSHLNEVSSDDLGENATVIKELFCMAAADLAHQMGEPLESLGVLYEDTLTTGTSNPVGCKLRQMMLCSGQANSADFETGASSPTDLDRGQLLFLVKQATRAEATKLQSQGFRFRSMKRVRNVLARDVQAKPDAILAHLESMRNSAAGVERILEPGVHLACFATRERIAGGFDVLVPWAARNQLPARRLALESVAEWQREWLSHMDGCTVAACLGRLHEQTASLAATKEEQMFAMQMRDALSSLADELANPIFRQATLRATPVEAPCRSVDESGAPGQAQLIVFRIILPLRSLAAPKRQHIFVPLSFFRCQQYVYSNAPDHDVFARQIHREFGPIVEFTTPSTIVYQSTSSRGGRVGSQRKHWGIRERRWSGLFSTMMTMTTTKMADDASKNCPLEQGSPPRWGGGILIREEVDVNVEPVTPPAESWEMIAGGELVPTMETGVERDGETFVETLLAGLYGG